MPRSKSSKKWLHEHVTDVYVQRAQKEGYRSRAIYKLQEIDERDKLLKPGLTIVDLGAAPGSWSQYASQKLEGKGRIIALDILPMDTLADVEFIQGDFSDDEVLDKLLATTSAKGVDLVLSDMAPNMSGNMAVDIPRAMYLVDLALDFAQKTLRPGGIFVVKVFHGSGFDELIKQVRACFERVVTRKPKASRSRSRETYIVAKNFK